MATLIKTDGTQTEIPIPNLEQAQKLVGGYVEIVYSHPTKKLVMLVNEDGRSKQLPVNPTASAMYGAGTIVGDIVVMEKRKAGIWR